MVSKRLKDKITETSKSALTDAKRRVSDLELEDKRHAAVDAAKTTALSTDVARRRAHNALKTTGVNLLSNRERISSEAAAAALALESVVSNVSYADLSGALQAKFKAAGLGGERGARTAAEAQSFYEASVPDAIKMLGGDAIKEYLAGKDASHITSYENAPELAKSNSNLLWEASSANRARGAADMTGWEQIQVNLSNGFETFAMAAGEIVPQATLYAAAIEGGISIIENSIYVYRGHKDVSTAIYDVAKNTAKSAVIGLVAGTAIAGIATLGGAPVIAAVAPALCIVGGAILVYSAAKRIHTALTAPLYDYDERGKVIDSYVTRYVDSSDDELLMPLNNQLEMFNALKSEILTSIPKEVLKQLPAAPRERAYEG